jgi:hypothetical protein
LIRLPKSFVELYGIVNKVKGRDEVTTLDEADDAGSAETAICLLTGAVMRSGSSRRAFSRAVSLLLPIFTLGVIPITLLTPSFLPLFSILLFSSNALLEHALYMPESMAQVSAYSSWYKSVPCF